jgi:hypothetical protein
MDLLTTPKLRLGQLQSLGESSIDYCDGLTEIEPEWAKANSSYIAFKASMTKVRVTAKKKRALDVSRDRKVTGFMNVTEEERKYDHDDKVILKALEALLIVEKNYGTKITRFSRAEETSAIDNLLTDVAMLDLTPLLATGIPRWVPKIEAANEAYKDADEDYNTDSTDETEANSAGSLAPALEHDLNELYAMLYAAIKRTPTPELIKAYAKLEILIDSLK